MKGKKITNNHLKVKNRLPGKEVSGRDMGGKVHNNRDRSSFSQRTLCFIQKRL
jgi:hypothetical protein